MTVNLVSTVRPISDGGSRRVMAFCAGTSCSMPARHTVWTVQFSRDLRDAVAAGRITVSVRLWTRPQVREGGRYRVNAAQIEVDSVELMPFDALTAEDVQRAGELDLETLRQRAAHAGPISGDTLVYRVEFHILGGCGYSGVTR
jgi:uncharacterized protein YqfB (UPF0267 family)